MRTWVDPARSCLWDSPGCRFNFSLIDLSKCQRRLRFSSVRRPQSRRRRLLREIPGANAGDIPAAVIGAFARASIPRLFPPPVSLYRLRFHNSVGRRQYFLFDGVQLCTRLSWAIHEPRNTFGVLQQRLRRSQPSQLTSHHFDRPLHSPFSPPTPAVQSIRLLHSVLVILYASFWVSKTSIAARLRSTGAHLYQLPQ